MEYLVDGSKFNFRYSEVKDAYEIYVTCKDTKFIKELVKVLHLSCFICYFKEIPTYVCLSDKGLIHELVHMLESKEYHDLHRIRKLFEQVCKLA